MMSLQEYCSTPEFKRDGEWEKSFLDSFVAGKVTFDPENVHQGPDGWPYYFISSLGDGHSGEPVVNILHWLKDKGIGLALNPDKSLPDYIFTYGMIWNFAERNLLIEFNSGMDDSDTVEFNEGEKVFFGKPSPELIPSYVYPILKDYLSALEIENPRIAIVGKSQEDFNICFSAESLGNPPEEDHQQLLERLSWFFPTHYGLMILAESSLGDFYELDDVIS